MQFFNSFYDRFNIRNKISIRVVCVNGKRPRSYLVLLPVSLKQKDQKHGYLEYIVKQSAGYRSYWNFQLKAVSEEWPQKQKN